MNIYFQTVRVLFRKKKTMASSEVSFYFCLSRPVVLARMKTNSFVVANIAEYFMMSGTCLGNQSNRFFHSFNSGFFFSHSLLLFAPRLETDFSGVFVDQTIYVKTNDILKKWEGKKTILTLTWRQIAVFFQLQVHKLKKHFFFFCSS